MKLILPSTGSSLQQIGLVRAIYSIGPEDGGIPARQAFAVFIKLYVVNR